MAYVKRALSCYDAKQPYLALLTVLDAAKLERSQMIRLTLQCCSRSCMLQHPLQHS